MTRTETPMIAINRFVAPAIGGLLLLTPAVALAVQTNAPKPPERTGAKATVVAKGLENPWGLAFLPNGNMLVTERPGRIRLVTPDGKVSKPLKGAPKASENGQGGMLDIVLGPDFATSRRVYISFAQSRNWVRSATAVAQARLEGDGLDARFTNAKVIFQMQPASRGGRHFGSRLVFAPDGKLFITLGDRGLRDPSQDLKSTIGKVVRINPDGSVPKDNPFVKRQGAKPEIWSYGHRNIQGAALHPGTGALWTVEHGAAGGDEINIPLAGKNYGWPVISYGTHYSGRKIGLGSKKAGMEQPVYYWDPSIAPSGMAFYSADRFPQWKGNLFIGALKSRYLTRLILEGDKIVGEEVLLRKLGHRIRDVRQGPDGALYVLTDSDNGRILRVEPAK